MTAVWIIITFVTMCVLWEYVWLILFISGAALALVLVLKAKKARDAEARRWRKSESEKVQEDITHKYYYNSSASANVSGTKPPQSERHYYPTTPAVASDKASSFVRYAFSAPPVHQGCPMVYRYTNIPVSNVNRFRLEVIIDLKKFDLTPTKDEFGNILLKMDGNIVARLDDKIDICRDWLDKGLPMICEFSEFAVGKERVALFFYKDVESNLAGNSREIVRLTSCLSPSKQEAISCLEEGQVLFIEYGDDGKPYVRDIEYNPIGALPSKYTKMYDDGLVSGLFFDHTEAKESDDFESDDKQIPYVRIYTEMEQ